VHARNKDDEVCRRLIRWLLIVGLALAIGGLICMATGVFDRVHNTLTVIAFSILFGYLVYPPVKWLANRRIPVILAGIIVYFALGIVVLCSLHSSPLDC
jgi:predicted PurR-regulated permease PerM